MNPNLIQYIPATEPPSEPPPHGIATSTSPLMIEPLLPQSETPMTPLDTVTSGFNPHAGPTTIETSSIPTMETLAQDRTNITKPDNWAQMSKKQRKNWYQRKL